MGTKETRHGIYQPRPLHTGAVGREGERERDGREGGRGREEEGERERRRVGERDRGREGEREGEGLQPFY